MISATLLPRQRELRTGTVFVSAVPLRGPLPSLLPCSLSPSSSSSMSSPAPAAASRLYTSPHPLIAADLKPTEGPTHCTWNFNHSTGKVQTRATLADDGKDIDRQAAGEIGGHGAHRSSASARRSTMRALTLFLPCGAVVALSLLFSFLGSSPSCPSDYSSQDRQQHSGLHRQHSSGAPQRHSRRRGHPM